MDALDLTSLLVGMVGFGSVVERDLLRLTIAGFGGEENGISGANVVVDNGTASGAAEPAEIGG